MNRFVIIFLLMSFLLVSCDNRQTKSLLQDVETYIQERPDSALRVLRSVDPLMLNTKSLHARYSLLFAMALDKNYIDTTDVSVVMPAVNYYKRHGNPDERLKAYFYLGRIYLNNKRYDKAAVAYSLAEKEALRSTDVVQNGILYMNLSYLYDLVHNKNKQLEYANKGMACYQEAGDSTRIFIAYGDLARAYHSRHNWRKADSLYRLGLEKARNDTLAVVNLIENYAKMKMIIPEPDPEGAISLLEILSSDYQQPLSVMEYGIYAYASDLLGDCATCDHIIQQLENLDDNRKSMAFMWLYLIYRNRGDYKKALDYEIAADKRSEGVLDSLLAVPVSQGLQNYYRANANESRLRSHRVVAVSVTVFVFVILSFVILLLCLRVRIMNKRKKEELVLRLLENSNHMLEQENTELKSKTIEYERERYKARHSFISVYKDRFSMMGELYKIFLDSKNRQDEKEAVYYRVEHLISDISTDDNLFARLESQINHDFDDMVIHLKKDLGCVDKKEVRFICYLIVGLDPQIIASLLNLSVSNVYTKKSRLRDRIKNMDSPYKDDYLLVI